MIALMCLVSACGSAQDAATGAAPTTSFVCPATGDPAVLTVDTNPTYCPTVTGKWDFYEITRNAAGTVTGVKRTCSILPSSVIPDQLNFNRYLVGMTDTNPNDYAVSPSCTHGSKTQSNTDVITYIYKLK